MLEMEDIKENRGIMMAKAFKRKIVEAEMFSLQGHLRVTA